MSETTKEIPSLAEEIAGFMELSKKGYSFVLATDGSGWQDGFGGGCSIVLDINKGNMYYRFFGAYGTSVERSEFEALLYGLESIMTENGWYNGCSLNNLSILRPKVLWITDRESLALSVKINPSTGQSYYKRKASPDLWARFEWFEERFEIDAQHIKRMTSPMQNLADRLASEMRTLTKNYGETLIADNVI
jgi:ribonuclease HI